MATMTKEGTSWMVLLKLGERQHLEELRRGILYMRSLAYFSKLEDELGRGDVYEGTDYLYQLDGSTEINFNLGLGNLGKFTGSPSEAGSNVRISMSNTVQCSLFCMFAVTKPFDEPMFPNSVQWPGEFVVLFTNTQEFLNRVSVAARSGGFTSLQMGDVDYVDANIHTGKYGRFRKRSIYSHQCEYRIALEPLLKDPYQLEVGDLTDITSPVMPRVKADEILKFRSLDLAEAGLNW